jgi:hypothetical protein
MACSASDHQIVKTDSCRLRSPALFIATTRIDDRRAFHRHLPWAGSHSARRSQPTPGKTASVALLHRNLHPVAALGALVEIVSAVMARGFSGEGDIVQSRRTADRSI